MQEDLIVGGKIISIAAQKISDKEILINVGGKEVKVELLYYRNNELILKYEGKKFHSFVSEYRGNIYITIDGFNYHLQVKDSDENYSADNRSSGDEEIKSPLPGKVVKICVDEGAKIKSGDLLIIVEAMKMENNIYASCDLIVENIFVEEGESVNTEKKLMKIKPLSTE